MALDNANLLISVSRLTKALHWLEIKQLDSHSTNYLELSHY